LLILLLSFAPVATEVTGRFRPQCADSPPAKDNDPMTVGLRGALEQCSNLAGSAGNDDFHRYQLIAFYFAMELYRREFRPRAGAFFEA
jgi:hypothetical protein